ncbi:MAG TPA: hypothetical protein VFL69_08265 [Marmoricola sp.]|jgi:hypothetical protein|nr:hypothetical protein [Marmoricola sp.]
MTPVVATIWLTFMILAALVTFGGGAVWISRISNADHPRKEG